MKTIAFLAGFILVAAVLAPRIAAGDPEPSMAELSLYIFGAISAIACATGFTLTSAKRRLPIEPILALCIGALCSGGFYGALQLSFPAISLDLAVLASVCVSVLVALALPPLFPASA